MKKYLVLIFTVFVAGVFFGHPPSDIMLKYKPAVGAIKGVLSVDVKHAILSTAVKDPKKHFIKEIVLLVNGKEIEKKDFTKQETVTGQTAKFKVDLKPGDIATVSATCSIKGTKTATYTQPEAKGKTK
jgi:desulfoferrodoxin (superoxide reductase-like protein)